MRVKSHDYFQRQPRPFSLEGDALFHIIPSHSERLLQNISKHGNDSISGQNVLTVKKNNKKNTMQKFTYKLAIIKIQ